MNRHGRICFLVVGFLCLVRLSFGQSVTIESITISGIKHTRESIIHRELTVQQGDSIPQSDIGLILERNRNNLLNLGLFNEVIVNVSEWDTKRNTIDITVDLKESWYIYVLPILDLADRNFNVWWTTYNHRLDRLNLGAHLEWLNFTGRNDKLKAVMQLGYTPKQELEYRFPFLNKQQSIGVTTGLLHSINKEVSYATVDNREQFIRLDERRLQERWQGQISAFYRPSIFIRYEIVLNYTHVFIDPEVISDYNPVLFRKGNHTHGVLGTRFAFEYDDRDLKIFPSHGIKTRMEIEKLGLGEQDDENTLVTSLAMEWNTTTGRKFQHRAATIGQYSLSRSRPSFIYYGGLGSNRKYISGYELYVVNGLDFVVGKYQVAYKLLERQVKVGKLMPFEQFRKMPVALYLSLGVEGGYVHDPFTGDENFLANRWLYGGGPGGSVLLYNNFLFQVNYSVNHLGTWGLFIHNRTSF